ncbi:MAG TPA: hypothetical protein VHT03_14540 [Rhizomicrobium sp.]|nr:hypothetical protein [Rhizomicrobium sp.]
MVDEDERAPADVDAAAVGIAMNHGTPEALAYLREQTDLARLQRQYLSEQNAFELSHLRWRRFNDQMRGAIQIMAIAVGAVVVIALGAALWNASQAEGLVVDAFSVPAGYAARGVGGDVVASDLTNRIADVRNRATGYSSAGTVSKNDANALSVEIPETGVSLAAVWRALRGWLGHERHLGGNLREMPDGTLVLTATFDSGDAITVSGRELGNMEQAAAEKVFSTFDPASWFNYLINAGRYDELVKLNPFADVHDAHTLSEAYLTKGSVLAAFLGQDARGIALTKVAEAYDPAFATPHNMLVKEYDALGRVDGILDESRKILTLKESDQPKHLQGRGFAILRSEAQEAIARWHGDFADALQHVCVGECVGAYDLVDIADLELMQHDGSAARACVDRAELFGEPDKTGLAAVEAAARAEVGDWAGAAAQARAGIAFNAGNPDLWLRFSYREQALQLGDLLAVAEANLGDVPEARATLARTGGDCYPCLIARGDVDAIAKDWGAAEYWYAAAARRVPESPFAYNRWGAALLHRGNDDGAIAKFEEAHAKGPHFADPLELWGEALMAKNRSDLALAKFEEADKYAPHWGRLHLKWGEALYWTGDRTGAEKQFATAAALDLSASEKSQLAQRPHG